MARKSTQNARKTAPKAPARRKSAAQEGPTAAERLVDTLLALLTENAWQKISLSDIAQAAGLTPAEAAKIFPDKTAVLEAFIKRIDDAVLTGPSGDGSVRDRLFDLLMGRFDALSPYKAAVATLARGLATDPCTALRLVPRLRGAMARTLEHAGGRTKGLAGLGRTEGLMLIYANTLRVWLKDDSADMGATMAALDAGLRRAETLATACPGPWRAAA